LERGEGRGGLPPLIGDSGSGSGGEEGKKKGKDKLGLGHPGTSLFSTLSTAYR